MIFYFSGTGNSAWVAKQIAAGTDDIAIDIGELIKSAGTQVVPEKAERIGIVFPVYAWGAPNPVIQFAKKLKAEKDVYRFAVCTCGDEAGLSLRRFSRNFPLDGAWSVIMPNNYIFMYDLDSPDLARRKVNNAKTKIPEICEAIRSKKKVWDVYKGPFPYAKSYLINPLFKRFTGNPKGFEVESSCISCGLCEKKCPLGNISIKGGKPEWGKNCTQCLACIHHCPVQAIQYGKSTKNKGRYIFENMVP